MTANASRFSILVFSFALVGPGLASTAAAREELRRIRWDRNYVAPAQLPHPARVEPARGANGDNLLVESGAGEPVTVTIARIESPGIASSRYLIEAEVRGEEVAAGSYLEMWTHLPTAGRYFTRTVADSGPMRSLAGTFDWRRIVLPFSLDQTAERPELLELNVVLAGPGRVHLGPIRLVELSPTENPLTADTASRRWWSGRTAGLIGGIAGVLFGCVSAVIGWLTSRGRARGFVVTAMRAMFAAGALALAVGLAAAAEAQPYAVYYPLIVFGILAVVIVATTLPRIQRRYEHIELRRMRALDTG